jgi:hypothetical protein
MRKSFSRQEGTEALSIGKVKGRPGRSLFGEATLTHLAVGHRKGRLSATETLRHRDDLATGYYSVHTNADAKGGNNIAEIGRRLHNQGVVARPRG